MRYEATPLPGFNVGWGQRCFNALAHHQFLTFHDGGPALEASWSHPIELTGPSREDEACEPVPDCRLFWEWLLGVLSRS